MRRFGSLLLLLLTVSAAAQTSGYTTDSNIGYYEQAPDAYAKQRCVLDIYYPKGKKEFATVIWFHGGGLTAGEKEIPQQLKDKGLCVIGVNYRLSPKAKVSQCIEDAAASIAWTFKNIAKYGGSDSKIFVSGHSAGGYLAAMAVLDKKWLSRYSIDANRVAGLIPLSGQMITHFTARGENGIPDKQPVVDDLSPLYHVRGDAPPILLITGDRELEMIGRYEENAYMERMLKLNGQKQVKLYELDGYGHLMVEPALPLVLKEIERVLKEQKQTN